RYPLPRNIFEYVRSFSETRSDVAKDYQSIDASLLFVLQKIYDIPFVPPIDVNTGATTNNQMLKDRYWTVFKPGAFETIALGERQKPSRMVTMQMLKRALRRILRSV